MYSKLTFVQNLYLSLLANFDGETRFKFHLHRYVKFQTNIPNNFFMEYLANFQKSFRV